MRRGRRRRPRRGKRGLLPSRGRGIASRSREL